MTGEVALSAAHGLPELVRQAASKIANAESAAEILEAREMAGAVYDAAKRAARFARAKSAHDTILSTVYRAQADALEIESLAKRRLADEYDAAQERGEVRKQSDNQAISQSEKAGFADIGLTGKEIHEARQVRDAERADPGVTQRTLDTILSEGREPTKAAVRREIMPKPKPKYTVSDESLWVWGRLCDFEQRRLFGADPRQILINMTQPMREDVMRLAPLVRELMEELEMCFEPA